MDDGEVALHNWDEYNRTPSIGCAERHYHSPFSCMREYYYPRKGKLVSPWQSGTKAAYLQRRPASLDQAHKGPEPHAPSLGIQLVVLVVVSFTFASCIPHAQLVNETATGGTVLYSYVEEQDVLTSPGRKDALLLLEEKCLAGYRIAREGEVPRIDQAVDRAWMGQLSRDGQVSREKRWAIQFSCK
jgi:hypothetical protein